MPKKTKRETDSTKKAMYLVNVKNYSIYLLLVWTLYRVCFFGLAYELDELFIKPLFWITPIIYFVKKERENIASLGFSIGKFFPSIYFVLALGAGFAIEGFILNIIKYKGVNFSSYLGQGGFWGVFLISLVTAFVEEISFRGYLFNRLHKALGDEIKANIISSVVWAMVHVPVVVLVWGANIPLLLLYFALVFIFGVGSSFVYARSGNILASVLLHLFWEWPIILFR